MGVELYFLKLSPPSRSVLMLLKQLDIKVDLKHVNLKNGDHLTPEYAKV